MFRLHLVKPSDDLPAICDQMQPSLWDKDNDMSSYQPELLKKFLEANGILLLAYADQTIVGAALCYELPHPGSDHSLYIHELDTHPDYRRKGVATLLMDGVRKIAAGRGHVEYWLATETDNDPANALYESLKPYEIEPSITYSYKVN